MFTLALVSFASYRYCYLQFQTLSAFHGIERKTFDFTHIHSFLRKLLTTTATCVRHWVSKWLVSLIWSIHLVISTRKCIEKACRKLITYKLENRIPWLFTGFANIKDFPWLFKKFPDFSLTLKNCFSSHFSLAVATLLKIARKIHLAILTSQSNIFTWWLIESMPPKKIKSNIL